MKISFYENVRGYINLVGQERREWFAAFLSIIPGQIGSQIRRKFSGLKYIGSNVDIHSYCRFFHAHKISIGNNSVIGTRSILNGAGGITIGENVLLGPEVFLWTQNHKFDLLNKPIKSQGWDYKPIEIKNDVWIGARVIVLPGVSIGEGAVVGAGSVVTRDLQSYTVYFGYPARKISER